MGAKVLARFFLENFGMLRNEGQQLQNIGIDSPIPKIMMKMHPQIQISIFANSTRYYFC